MESAESPGTFTTTAWCCDGCEGHALAHAASRILSPGAHCAASACVAGETCTDKGVSDATAWPERCPNGQA